MGSAPRPPRDDWLAAKLKKHVRRSTRLLADLTSSSVDVDPAGREVVKLAAMPKTAIVAAQGLAFVFRKKAGALLSLTRERAFLVAKHVHEDGSTCWSGPVFCRGTTASLGLSAGFMDMRLCLAVRNEAGLEEVLRPYHTFGVTCSFLLDMNGSRLRPLHTSSGSSAAGVQGDESLAKYFIVDAAMVDLSVRGGRFKVDAALNRAVYGPGVSVGDVLQRRVPPPPEFTPLYALLNEYTREVHALRALPSGVRLSLASPVGTSPRMYSPEEGRPRREGSTAATPTPARSSPRGDGISAASSVQGSPAAQGLAGGSRLATTQTEEEEDAAYQTVTGSVQQKRPRLDGLFDF